MAIPFFGPKTRFFDADGAPLSGGKLYTYAAGTTTPKATYTTAAGTVANTNPVILDAQGYADVWLGSGAYKVRLCNSADVELWTVDNYQGDSSIGFAGKVYNLSANTNLTSLYNQSVIIATGSINLSLLDAPVAGEGYCFTLYNNGTNSVVVTPDAGDTINGASFLTLAAKKSVMVVCNGTIWYAVFLNAIQPGEITYAMQSQDMVYRLAHGECRLTKSGSNLLLSPYNGNNIIINGVQCTIPSSGVTLAPTALGPGTTYYIYVWMNGATMTLEAAGTGPAADPTSGVVIKAGDPTRTLVGMARPVTGPAWQDTEAQRFVLSWFNRIPLSTKAVAANAYALASATPVEISAGLRNEFLIWGSDVAQHSFNTTCINSANNTTISVSIGYDGTTMEPGTIAGAQTSLNTPMPFSATYRKTGLSEGYHYATMVGFHTAATTTFQYSASNGFQPIVCGVING